MRRREVLLSAAATGVVLAAGPALAAPSAELVDERWLGTGDRDGSDIDHGPWDTWLGRYVVPGSDGITRVRYGDVTAADRDLLAAYLADLAAVAVTSHKRPDQLAYWINLYNALTVALVVRAYPVASIRDIDGGLFSLGPWGRELIEVEGRALSLDAIEHGILRPIWRDSRIHYAVNCASLGCPNLAPAAYRAGSMEERLDESARGYVNHPRGAAFDEQGRLVVSSIYVWFEADFGGSEAGVIDHLRAYAREPLASELKGVTSIYDDRYDWALNDAGIK
jgi:Protein of unknown function, DUF547